MLKIIVLIVLGVKGNVFKENRQNMELRSSGDDNSHWSEWLPLTEMDGKLMTGVL